MAECAHRVLVLCTTAAAKLRCRHCHLTISRDELDAGRCPECYEERGVERNDFEQMVEEDIGTVRYRCEECSLVIEIAP